jgi:hypothetical protein
MQVATLITMQLFVVSRYFFPQYHIVDHPQSTSLSTPCKTTGTMLLLCTAAFRFLHTVARTERYQAFLEFSLLFTFFVNVISIYYWRCQIFELCHIFGITSLL